MTSNAQHSRIALARAAKAAAAAEAQVLELESASPEQLEVVNRIEAQRERIHARRLALQQARALKDSAPARVDAEAPLPIKLLTFAKLHPVAVAAAVGVALVAGPTRVMRIAGVVLPIIMRLRR